MLMWTSSRALWRMARPLILVSVVLVYAAGILMARAEDATISFASILWGGVALLLVTLAAHYVNEYADVETDALTQRTLYSGGSGVLPQGNVPRGLALAAGWVSLGLGLGIGLAGYLSGGVNALAVGILILGALGGWFYSMPPLRLAWHGWGELDNGLLGGLIYLYGYVAVTGELPLRILVAVLPFTLLNINNLLATTWADRQADAQVGKRTLATRWPIPRLRTLYGLSALSAFVLIPLGLPALVALCSLASVPMALWGWRTYTLLHSPYPTSNTMVVLLLAQMLGWYWLGAA
jgi:1,4-dihydroxy-2-naphthoate octaprenyltransferase